ncbi:MAG TPA: TetR/AcrR family transcriptional regulator [Gaiellaceae bacterium]|nr:TetR/AcrR family transcriptional regulator [Gaiellaceae bacterium]
MALSQSSPLREQHAELTRELILGALVDLLQADERGEISVPEVARKAGVSLRTVYRYFPTRDELFAAGTDWIFARTLGDVQAEETIDDLVENTRALAERWEAHPKLARALVLSPTGGQLRRHRREQRRREIGRVVDATAGRLTEAERKQVTAVLGLVHSLRFWVALRDDLGLSREDAAAAVDWALRALIDDVRRRNRAAGRKGGRT